MVYKAKCLANHTATLPKGKFVALKAMSKGNPETELVMKDEVEVMRACGAHENLVSLHA